MKQKKQKEIIESAIKLFAENGFHTTSVQDIVNDCGISKGAFYNYFSSKEELHIAIFQYYFEQMRTRALAIEKELLNPREKLIKHLSIPFEQWEKQREFFTVYLREQSFSINKDLRKFFEKTLYETIQNYEKLLKEIYGEAISAYIGDIILLIEGMRNGYLGAMLFHNLPIDTAFLPHFLMNRIDDIVQAFKNGEEPMIKEHFAFRSFAKGEDELASRIEKATSLLADMQEQLEVLVMEEEKKSELVSVLDFLAMELKKTDFEKYVFQGILANLKEVKEFDIYRDKIATLLEIQLL